MRQRATEQRHLSRLAMKLSLAAALLALGGVYVASQAGALPIAPMGITSTGLLGLLALPWLMGLWLAALGYGYALRRLLAPGARDALVIQLAAGMAALLSLDWLVFHLVGVGRAQAWAVCLGGWVLLAAQAALHWRQDTAALSRGRLARLGFLLPAAPAVGALLVAAACPPGALWPVEAFGYDALSYHLQLPREWLALGQMQGLEHNAYSYLPNLVEAGYLQLLAMIGQPRPAAYVCQMFHASLALLAGGAAASVAWSVGRSWLGAVAAGAVVVAAPWTLITGSLAYNEMAVLALAGGAWALAVDRGARGWRPAVLVGFLLGAATLAKLTAGPMLAAPLLVGIALGLHRPSRLKRSIPIAAVAALAMAAALSPYLVRNTLSTGNPVFPLMADSLGNAHWTDAQAQRWAQAHTPDAPLAERLEKLDPHWLRSAGYGALGGDEPDRDAWEMARFGSEGGMPTLWLITAALAIAALTRPGLRRGAILALGVLGAQLIVWLFATHQQSRFLIPTLLPAGVLCGLGLACLHRARRNEWQALGYATALLLPVLLTAASFSLLWSQTRTVLGPQGRPVQMLPGQLVDSMSMPGRRGIFGEHPINTLPRRSKVYVLADVGSLFYIDRPFVYESAFDRPLLARLLETHGRNPIAVTRALRRRGVTHVWVGWSEIQRLGSTYGYDPLITDRSLQHLIMGAGWSPLLHLPGGSSLYQLPWPREQKQPPVDDREPPLGGRRPA